jgi:hypothetical protein
MVFGSDELQLLRSAASMQDGAETENHCGTAWFVEADELSPIAQKKAEVARHAWGQNPLQTADSGSSLQVNAAADRLMLLRLPIVSLPATGCG